MARVCVLLAPGFEEIEATTIVDVLRRAEVDVVTLGVGGTEIRGAHGITVLADRPLESSDERWDMVILPGGMPGSTNLRDDPMVQSLVRAQARRGGGLGAICAAPIALAAAGVIGGRSVTCYPGFEDQLTGGRPSSDRVVVDGDLVTSRGPGTALEFALTLAARLAGKETANALREGMLAAAT